VWQRLWAATRPVPPMLEYRWVQTWWRLHRREGKLLVILIVDGDDGGRPVGLAPLYLRRDCQDPVGLLRTVHFLGTGERESDEVASEYLGWLAPPERIAEVTRAVGGVLRDQLEVWDRIRLVNIAADHGLQAELAEAMRPMAHALTVVARPTFRIRVGPLEDYLAALPSANFRHRCRRALRAGVEAGVELVTATRPEEVQALFAVLTDLHQRRWSERGRPGVFESAVFREFHQALLPGFVADGSAWLAGLRQGDRWLAVRYHLRAGDRVFDYVSGVDTHVSPALGPGLLLTLHALEWCRRAGVHSYDLLAGDYEYKRRLATEVDEIYDLDVFAPTLPAQLWLAARRLRSRLRASPAAPASPPGEPVVDTRNG
jgi:CelD/BcsL family acetyltransferase involved in cellulose biosynthesis